MLMTHDLNTGFLVNAPKFLFFTGKGGVGKTSLSAASAIILAENGKKVLIVSTDPASNLDQVLGTKLGSKPTKVAETTNLWAMNIDPRKSAAEYKERVVKPYRGVLPEAAVSEIEERLSGACTVEISAFDEFSKLMTDSSTTLEFDHIIFDTAPTGHTLRLLKLPSAWKGYFDDTGGSASCLGPMSGLKGQYSQFEDTLNALNDKNKTILILVARPDKHSIDEAERTRVELKDIGICNLWFAINGILNEAARKDEVAMAIRNEQKKIIENMPHGLTELNNSVILLSSSDMVGIKNLRKLFQRNPDINNTENNAISNDLLEGMLGLNEFINKLDIKTGIIMTMGKGGVGKTTIATAIALDLAGRGLKVHLTTSDPAAHLDFSVANKYLRVSRIDPVAETKTYREEVLTQSGTSLDENGKKLLEEDLLSPCTEEVAVFRAFAKIVAEAADSIVVLDTAPTGHTLLLLDATEAYNKEVSRNQNTTPDEIKQLLPRLRNIDYTKIIIVTLPETTPIQEASDLQDDLRRAGIKPYAWIVNKTLSTINTIHPVLNNRRAAELKKMELIKKIAGRTAYVPFLLR